MHHPTHKLLRAAYSFYNVSGATPWVDLMQDALVVAKNVSACLLVCVCVCVYFEGGRGQISLMQVLIELYTCLQFTMN